MGSNGSGWKVFTRISNQAGVHQGSFLGPTLFLVYINDVLNLCFNSGDVEVLADNTQRKGKTRRVREDDTIPIGIATNAVFIQPSRSVQKIKELAPRFWSGTKLDIADLIINKEERLRNSIFLPYRCTVQEEISKDELSEKSLQENCDSVDLMLAPGSEQLYLCMKRGSEIPNSASSCSACHHQYMTSPDRKSMYNVPNGHPKYIPLIKLGKIIGFNTNSYSSIKKMFCNLISQTVSDERTWIRVVFDDVPYKIAKELIENTVKCLECADIIELKEESFEEHLKELHYGEMNIGMEKYFGNFFLAPGPGYIEKKFPLTVFKFTKNVFLLEVACKLGFKSTKAKEFVINCRWQHLSWEIAMIVSETFSKELIHVYIEHCNDEGILADSSQLMIWRNE